MSSVTFAMKNKMNLSINIAISSSLQIGLFVTPVLVIAGWIFDQPMTLFFEDFETVVLFASVFVVNYLIQDGRSNWLEGVLLLVRRYILVSCNQLESKTNVLCLGFVYHYLSCILVPPCNISQQWLATPLNLYNPPFLFSIQAYQYLVCFLLYSCHLLSCSYSYRVFIQSVHHSNSKRHVVYQLAFTYHVIFIIW